MEKRIHLSQLLFLPDKIDSHFTFGCQVLSHRLPVIMGHVFYSLKFIWEGVIPSFDAWSELVFIYVSYD